jgi:hypothetical protein
MITIGYAIWSDRKQGVPRDSVHWIGVGLFIGTSLLMWVMQLAWWLTD